MPAHSRRAALVLLAGGLAACARRPEADVTRALPVEAGSSRTRSLIEKWARVYDVPPALVHRVVKRESNYNPAARNGPYMGLMQIHPQTARTMGFRGAPADLLDAETNLQFAVKYLRGAWMVADGSYDRAVGWYSRGYYYEAKRRGLLKQTGLR